jgi:bifunctional enzyme CysN/CysC
MGSSSIEEMLESSATKSLLRISTAGSVDDGKSTFIGRLLYDCKGIYEDQIESLKGKLRADSFGGMDLALLTDGLRAEREQGITIDVAYRYFSTPKRHFIMADTPGHEQYTRNMATGASTANIAILLIDARNGITTQTKRHAFIASLLGIPRLMVAINKMDLMDWSEKVYSDIKDEFSQFAAKLTIKEVTFVPISALKGDNVVTNSENMPWYSGSPVIRYLEEVYIESDRNLVDFRFPVQCVLRPNQDFRGYAGQIASGSIKVGESVTILPSNKTTKVAGIHTYDGDLNEAHTPRSVAITLENEIDISRGDMIVRSKNKPRITSELEATIIWMSDTPLNSGQTYKIKHASNKTTCRITELQYKLDINSVKRQQTSDLKLNEIGRISLSSKQPLFIDNYSKNRSTGCFILVDEITNATLGAGTFIDRVPDSAKRAAAKDIEPESRNISKDVGLVAPRERFEKSGHSGITFWFTGLSGSGKSTIAAKLERELFDSGHLVCRLDGDNVRHGLCADLGFSDSDRSENIRRIAAVAKLFNDAGYIVLTSLISPFANDRQQARHVIGSRQFVEIFVDTPLEECEKRDPKGLYKKARSGQIANFTGISAPYEAPTSPDIHLGPASINFDETITKLLEIIKAKVKV